MAMARMESTEKGQLRKYGKLCDSLDEETSSDEDFNLLEAKFKDNKDLAAEELRLLRGLTGKNLYQVGQDFL